MPLRNGGNIPLPHTPSVRERYVVEYYANQVRVSYQRKMNSGQYIEETSTWYYPSEYAELLRRWYSEQCPTGERGNGGRSAASLPDDFKDDILRQNKEAGQTTNSAGTGNSANALLPD